MPLRGIPPAHAGASRRRAPPFVPPDSLGVDAGAASAVATPPFASSAGEGRAGDALDGGRLRAWVGAWALLAELPFALLISGACVLLFGVDEPRDRRLVLAGLAAAHVVKSVAIVLSMSFLLRPVDRWSRARGAARRDAALLVPAARAAYCAPARLALPWAAGWTFAILAASAGLDAGAPHVIAGAASPVAAAALFSLAVGVVALPLAYTLLAFLLYPVAARLGLDARAAGGCVGSPGLSLRSRLIAFALCLAAAPAVWMASIAAAGGFDAGRPTAWITLLFFIAVAVAWAVLVAFCVASSIVGPLRSIGDLVGRIAASGEPTRLEPLPVYLQDELGTLTAGVNAMIERLDDSAERLRAHVRERERLLDEAARSAAELRAVLDTIVDGVVAFDADGSVAFMNTAGRRLFGEQAARADGRGESGGQGGSGDGDFGGERASPPGDGRPRGAVSPVALADLPIARALAGETIRDEALVAECPATGREIVVRASAAPIRSERGAILGAVAVARDVTELVELDRLQDQFVRVAAHELKTPVTIVKGYAQALLRQKSGTPEASRPLLDAINRGADRMTRIVDDLLAIAQALLDRLAVSPCEADLSALVAACVAHADASALRHRVRLVDRIRGPALVRADPARIRQVLASLIENAIKYSPAGRDIEVMLTLGSAEGGPGSPSEVREAVVSVRDDGVGIPAAKQARLFRLFYRAHTDTAHDYGGMGVGLYLAREIVARHGGRTWFESREGEGSTFHFSLPLIADERAAPGAEGSPSSERAPTNDS